MLWDTPSQLLNLVTTATAYSRLEGEVKGVGIMLL